MKDHTLKQMTAEQILAKETACWELFPGADTEERHMIFEALYRSMRVYADQQTTSLREEVERLKRQLAGADLAVEVGDNCILELKDQISQLQKEKEDIKIKVLKEVIEDIKGIHPEYIAEMLKDQIEILEKGV